MFLETIVSLTSLRGVTTQRKFCYMCEVSLVVALALLQQCNSTILLKSSLVWRSVGCGRVYLAADSFEGGRLGSYRKLCERNT
jgi:hypothetical protein